MCRATMVAEIARCFLGHLASFHNVENGLPYTTFSKQTALFSLGYWEMESWRIKHFKKLPHGGWRDGSSIKSTDCSFRALSSIPSNHVAGLQPSVMRCGAHFWSAGIHADSPRQPGLVTLRNRLKKKTKEEKKKRIRGVPLK